MNLFEFADLQKRAIISTVKMDRHISVITTSITGLRETGFGSVETCQAFCDHIKERYQHVTFHEVTSRSDLDLIIEEDPDLVVLCSKYVVGDDNITKIWFSEFFAQHGIAYTGSDRSTLEFDSNKSKAKAVLLNSGIATAKFFLARPNQFTSEDQLPLSLPLFIKPLDAANGNGIDEHSLVHDFDSYRQKIDELFKLYGATALVEEVLPGREFTVAIFDDAALGVRSIMPIEIVPPKNNKGDRVLGFAEKCSNSEEIKTVEEPLYTAISALAGAAFSALGVRDFGRLDVKLDAFGVPHFLEANLVPGMTPDTSYFPRACAIAAMKPGAMTHNTMTEQEVAWKVVELGLNRATITAPVSSIPSC